MKKTRPSRRKLPRGETRLRGDFPAWGGPVWGQNPVDCILPVGRLQIVQVVGIHRTGRSPIGAGVFFLAAGIWMLVTSTKVVCLL